MPVRLGDQSRSIYRPGHGNLERGPIRHTYAEGPNLSVTAITWPGDLRFCSAGHLP